MRCSFPVLFILVFLFHDNFAQSSTTIYKKVRVDFRVGIVTVPAYDPEDTKGYTSPGGSYSIEPRYNISDKLAVGFKYFVADVLEANKHDQYIRSYLATGTYYFTTTRFRLFTGGGLGLSRLARLQDTRGGTVIGKQQFNLAFMPRGGFDAGRFTADLFFHFNTARPAFFLGTSIGVFVGGGRFDKGS